MTYPLIGNYGVNEEDPEGEKPHVQGFIMREGCDEPSNFRCGGTISDYLKKNKIIGIEGIDTRALTRLIRNKGAMNGAIVSGVESFNKEELLAKIKAYSIEQAVESVTIKAPYTEEAENPRYHIAVIDFGYKKNIVRSLKKRDCTVTVYPSFASCEEIVAQNPDGIMLTNGPGDPEKNEGVIGEIGKLLKTGIPTFGICLGHQLTALANGFSTGKLKYGHRGGNHPVKDLKSGRTYITSQNHGYAVLNDTVDEKIAAISHINMNDNTCEGIVYKNIPAFTVQFHPEACPGPEDTGYLFDDFLAMIDTKRKK
jgi:carbamoyl-phosphate synthase small subunit